MASLKQSGLYLGASVRGEIGKPETLRLILKTTRGDIEFVPYSSESPDRVKALCGLVAHTVNGHLDCVSLPHPVVAADHCAICARYEEGEVPCLGGI